MTLLRPAAADYKAVRDYSACDCGKTELKIRALTIKIGMNTS